MCFEIDVTEGGLPVALGPGPDHQVRNVVELVTVIEGSQQQRDGVFAVATDDDVDVRVVAQDPVVLEVAVLAAKYDKGVVAPFPDPVQGPTQCPPVTYERGGQEDDVVLGRLVHR
jgi:hypothetical protein